ncbi:MAG: serine hydrolase [Vicinamibacterales bacterium]
MRPLTVLSIAVILLAGQPRAQSGPLQSLLQTELAGFPATTGVHVKHLTTGEEAGVRADQDFSTASIIKLAFMVRAYQMADRKELDLDERITLTRAHLRHGTGVLQLHDLGLQPTLRDAITEMIITSDNTAADIVLMKVGGPAAVTRWFADNGYPRLASYGRPHDYRRDLLAMLDPAMASLTAEETSALMYASDGNPLFAHYDGLFTGPRAKWIELVRAPASRQRLARERNERTSTERKFWLGSMTPRDTTRLLESIERGTAASKASCEAMLLALRRQQLGARRLPHFVDVPVAHKTGDGGTIANDAGIIYARSGPIVVSFFANSVKGSYAEAEDRIGRLAERVVRHFDAPR